MVTIMLIAYLQSILWVHEEVSSNVIKHNGVLPVVKISIFPPYHSQGLYLDEFIPSNTLISAITFSQTSA